MNESALSSDDYKLLHAALLTHFGLNDWRFILRGEFALQRDVIASAETNARDFVIELIDYFEKRGEIPQLIDAAARARPNVEVLQALARRYPLADQPPPPPPPDKLDERYRQAIIDFDSGSVSLQVDAATTLLGLVQLPNARRFDERIYRFLRTQLENQWSTAVQEPLIETLEHTIRLTEPPTPRRLTNVNLQRIRLQNQDLTSFDLAFSNLAYANLESANLFRVRGYGVRLMQANLTKANLGEARMQEAQLQKCTLNGATLIAADLKNVNLDNATCKQAQLQSAHLELTQLHNVRFEQANLNDTYFLGATFNTASLKSIVKAFNWQSAHFDPAIRQRLQELAAS